MKEEEEDMGGLFFFFFGGLLFLKIFNLRRTLGLPKKRFGKKKKKIKKTKKQLRFKKQKYNKYDKIQKDVLGQKLTNPSNLTLTVGRGGFFFFFCEK